MNDSGHLIELAKGKQFPSGYHIIPPELEEAAQAALAGQKETVIDVRGTGPLPQWLRDRKRMMKKRKVRRRRKRKGK